MKARANKKEMFSISLVLDDNNYLLLQTLCALKIKFYSCGAVCCPFYIVRSLQHTSKNPNTGFSKLALKTQLTQYFLIK